MKFLKMLGAEFPLKVDKEKFDALLGRLMQTPPQTAKTIKPEGKAGSILPKPQSTPRKA